jgi:hypothetical protein
LIRGERERARGSTRKEGFGGSCARQVEQGRFLWCLKAP